MPQLDPMLPLDTPKGKGFAFWRTDYSQEHDTLYSVIITSTREVWDFPQPQVRGVENISMGRTGEVTPFQNYKDFPSGSVKWIGPMDFVGYFTIGFDPNASEPGLWTRA